MSQISINDAYVLRLPPPRAKILMFWVTTTACCNAKYLGSNEGGRQLPLVVAARGKR
jgi:hypothetical protein